MSAIQFNESEAERAAAAWLEGLNRDVKYKLEGAPAELRLKDAERLVGRTV